MSLLNLPLLNRRVSRFIDTEQPWHLAKKPLIAHPYDEEFEGDLSKWTLGGTQLSPLSTPIDPYANFTATSDWRYSLNSRRPSWLMMQPSINAAGFFPIHKQITIPTNLLVWGRFNFMSRYTATVVDGDHGIGFYLTATSGGVPDTNNSVQFYLNESDLNEYAIQWAKIEAGVATNVEQILTLGQERLSFDCIALQKIGSTIHFWVGNTSGQWAYLSSFTYAGATLDRVAIIVANNSSTAPGNMVMGVDFIRFVESATFLP